MYKIIMVAITICLSALAQDFSDGYSRMIQLGLIYNAHDCGSDSLVQKDTLKDTTTLYL
jgi:hypothetical protein